MTEDITLDDISHFLLNNKYHLTALELDFELIERGIENKTLRNFFTNPMNFDGVLSHNEVSTPRLKSSPSVSTIDSIDFAKYSDDGLQQSDERIKVLEFELRKKTDEVRKLREELTHMSVSTVNSSFVLDWLPTRLDGVHTEQPGSLLAHENRTLNFLINEYLLQHRLKLTAVSFSEEVTDQDLDSWDDVGLNIPKVPSLEYLLKTKLSTLEEFSYKSSENVETLHEEQEVQTDPMDNGLLEHYISLSNQLQDSVKALELECDNLSQAQIRDAAEMKTQAHLMIQQKRELNEAKSKLICAQRDLVQESFKRKVSTQAPYSTSGDIDMKSETVSEISNVMDDINNGDRLKGSNNTDEHTEEDSIYNKDDHQESGFSDSLPQRTVTKEFIKLLQLIRDEDSDAASTSIPLVASLDEFVNLTSEALPRLFTVVTAKDDSDLMMLLIQSTCLHPDTKQREKLLKFLINLYPEPSAPQRDLVLKQIETLAGYLGAFRVEAELITQIWEMLYEKPKLNSSKRILLANICGVVCPLAPPNLRSSLILSIHQQMLEEENDPKVVPHILSSIASTVPYLEDVDKIPIVVQLTLKYLLRPSQSSEYQRSEANNEPSSEDVVKEKLLPALAQWCLDAGVIHSSLVHEIMSSMTNLSFTNHNIEYQILHRHICLLYLILPFIEIWIKDSAPDPFDDFAEDPNSDLIVPIRTNTEPGLYQCTVIVSADKYRQMQNKFLRYTTLTIPQSCSDRSSESTSDSSLSCWSPWRQLRWLQTELVNKLVLILKDIAPKIQTFDLTDTNVISDLAKSQFTHTSMKSKETCTKVSKLLFDLCCRLSTMVVHDVIMPCITTHLYGSSDKGIDCDLKTEVVVTGLVSGQCAILGSLALLNPSSIAYDNLRRFLTNIFFLISAENRPCDGVKHSISTICACLGTKAVTDVVLPAMQPCVACSECSVQMLMCIVLLELVSDITDMPHSDDVVLQSIMDFMQSLIISPHESVRVLTIGPLVSILQISALSDSIKTQVFKSLTTLMKESVNFSPEISDATNTGSSHPCSEIIITALIQMINIVGSSSPDSFRDDAILPWLLGITEINNSTSDIARRSAIAMILYSTFSTLSYYLESSSVLESCLLPSLDRLKLDMLEIYPENVKEVESMSQDIRKRLDSRHRHSGTDSLHGVKGKISGLNFMNRNITMTSATSSLFGKIRDMKDSNNSAKQDDQLSSSSSSTSTTKSNITNFFSKRR